MQNIVPHERFPSGDSKCIVVVPFSLDELRERYGLTFEVGLDDLGTYRLAAIDGGTHGQLWFLKHDGDETPGTPLIADLAANTARIIREVLAPLLAIEEDQYFWCAVDQFENWCHEVAGVDLDTFIENVHAGVYDNLPDDPTSTQLIRLRQIVTGGY